MAPIADVPTLFTSEEAATALRVKKSWLERQAASRKIPFTMLGGCYRFTAEHLRRIVEIHEATPTGPIHEIHPHQETRTRQRAASDSRSIMTPLRARPRHLPDRRQTAA